MVILTNYFIFLKKVKIMEKCQKSILLFELFGNRANIVLLFSCWLCL
jgi:hypothetical protein